MSSFAEFLCSGAPVAASRARHDFPDEDVLAEAHALPDPPAVVKIIQGGWQDYIPLNALTNQACRFAFNKIGGTRDGLTIDQQAGGVVRLNSAKLDASKELYLTQFEFLEAFPRFVRLCKGYVAFSTQVDDWIKQ
ncbi:hypothetical protein VTO73DRAFT_3307 [Trametes versicolor]